MVVEVFSDDSGQGRFFELRIEATSDTITLKQAWSAATVNAIATDPQGNSSGFAFNRAAGGGPNRVMLPLIAR